jgi:ferric-dicitrate binding protein FerR (iron transport regulator)
MQREGVIYMIRKKNKQPGSKIERLIDIMFSDVEIPVGSMSKMRAWLVDSDKAEEKSAALYAKFIEIFKFNPKPELAKQLWPELARRLGMNETPVVVVTDPLGVFESVSGTESAEARRRLSFGKVASRVAAVLLPILVVGGVALWFVGRDRTNIVEISVPMGETMAIELPDGSTIEAESGATITYDAADFTANRLVALSGEAMFDVAEVLDESGEKVPFAVTADDLTVNVLGTIFRLSTDESAQAAEVSLYEGSVAVDVEERESGVSDLDAVLDAGERLSVNTLTGEQTMKLIPASEMAEYGFMPLLRFDEATLGDLAMALEMNHGVKFNIAEGVDPTQGRYSGSFEELSLDETLGMLSRIDTALSFRRTGEGVVEVIQK